MSKAMTKEERANRILANQARIAVLSAKRKERVAGKAEAAQRNVDDFCAFCATQAFAALSVDWSLDLEDIFKRCDKTQKRFVAVCESLMNDSFALRNDSDQRRYVFNLARTLLNGAKRGDVTITKSDVLATATKTDSAPDYVVISSQLVANSTQDRQSGIAQYVLEMLGFLIKEKQGAVTTYKANLNSKVARKIAKIIASM